MNQSVKVVDLSTFPITASRRGRVNQIRSKKLLLDTSAPGVHLEFSYMYVPDGYFTPRHRHHFDQIRYTLEGQQSLGLGPGVPPDTGPGVCAYTPEGVYYGPQDQKGDCTSLLLQFSGPSNTRFLSGDEMNTGYDRLKAKGATFENGVCSFVKPDGGRINQDSYEAIYEEFVGRKLVLPPGRYAQPTIMYSEQYKWVQDRRNGGIEHRHLGTFNEHRTSVGHLQMLPGSRLAAGIQEDAEIRYLLEGSVSYGGKTWGPDTYFYLPFNTPREEFASGKGATFFRIEVPMVGDVILAQSGQIRAVETA